MILWSLKKCFSWLQKVQQNIRLGFGDGAFNNKEVHAHIRRINCIEI